MPGFIKKSVRNLLLVASLSFFSVYASENAVNDEKKRKSYDAEPVVEIVSEEKVNIERFTKSTDDKIVEEENTSSINVDEGKKEEKKKYPVYSTLIFKKENNDSVRTDEMIKVIRKRLTFDSGTYNPDNSFIKESDLKNGLSKLVNRVVPNEAKKAKTIGDYVLIANNLSKDKQIEFIKTGVYGSIGAAVWQAVPGLKNNKLLSIGRVNLERWGLKSKYKRIGVSVSGPLESLLDEKTFKNPLYSPVVVSANLKGLEYKHWGNGYREIQQISFLLKKNNNKQRFGVITNDLTNILLYNYVHNKHGKNYLFGLRYDTETEFQYMNLGFGSENTNLRVGFFGDPKDLSKGRYDISLAFVL